MAGKDMKQALLALPMPKGAAVFGAGSSAQIAIARQIKQVGTNGVRVEVYTLWQRTKATEGELLARVFCWAGEHLTWVENRPMWESWQQGFAGAKRWSNACIDALVQEYRGRDAIEAKTGRSGAALYDRLKRMQWDKLKKEAAKKQKRILLDAELTMQELPPRATTLNSEGMPYDFAQWVDNVALLESRYLYYEEKLKMVRQDGKRWNVTRAHCTHCGKAIEVKVPYGGGTLHRKPGRCPHCHTKATYLYFEKAKYIQDEANVTVLQRVENGVAVRQLWVRRCYGQNYKNPRMEVSEKFRFFVTESGQKYAYAWDRATSDWNCTRYMWKRKNPNTMTNFYSAVYTRNVRQVLRGTPWQYSGLYEMAHIRETHKRNYCWERGYSPYILFRPEDYLSRYLRYPAMEYLAKLGFGAIVGDVLPAITIEAFNYLSVSEPQIHKEYFNPEGKTLGEVFPLTDKRDVKLLGRVNAGQHGLKLEHLLRKDGHEVTEEGVRVLSQCVEYHDAERIGFVLNFVKVKRACRYLLQQEKEMKMSLSDVLGDWGDYLHAAHELGRNMRDKSVLCPKDLKREHDTTIARCKVKKSGTENRAIAALYEQTVKRYAFSSGGLCIVVPRDAEEIILEGEKQDHCVGSYCERVASGETTILFVRRENAIEEAFYTMQVTGCYVNQCRGYKNMDRTKEDAALVKKFVDAFKKEVLRTLEQGTVLNEIRVRCAV